jgi:hypothetical protein
MTTIEFLGGLMSNHVDSFAYPFASIFPHTPRGQCHPHVGMKSTNQRGQCEKHQHNIIASGMREIAVSVIQGTLAASNDVAKDISKSLKKVM